MYQDIYKKPCGVVTRWANAENLKGEKGQGAKENMGRKGAPCKRPLAPGESYVMAEASGSGVIRHIWITFENNKKPNYLKSLKLECFWDGASKPAVSVPLGDFFCFNSARVKPLENIFFTNPESRSFNCYIPMPFKTGMKIVITNESETDTERQFFYQVDYTLGDVFTDETMYFHAFYNREVSTVEMQDYTILPQIKGAGSYLGASVGVIANPLMKGAWWGEGEVKCYIDGDGEYPTLAGTGTEDYIGTGWGQGEYQNLYQGSVISDLEGDVYSFYRFHVPDPVYFDEEIRVTIQQIGWANSDHVRNMIENGLEVYNTAKREKAVVGTIIERFDDDWCSIAYFYLKSPVSELKELPCAAERILKYDVIAQEEKKDKIVGQTTEG